MRNQVMSWDQSNTNCFIFSRYLVVVEPVDALYPVAWSASFSHPVASFVVKSLPTVTIRKEHLTFATKETVPHVNRSVKLRWNVGTCVHSLATTGSKWLLERPKRLASYGASKNIFDKVLKWSFIYGREPHRAKRWKRLQKYELSLALTACIQSRSPVWGHMKLPNGLVI